MGACGMRWYTTRQVMPSSGEVLGIVGLGGGRLQQSRLLWAASQTVFFGMLTGIAKKKKKIAKRVVQCLGLAAGGPGCCPSLRMPSQACTPGPHPQVALGLGRGQRGSGCDP